MKNKKNLRIVLTIVFVLAATFVGVYQIGGLKGQLPNGGPVLLSPVGEIVPTEGQNPSIRVAWTVGSMPGNNYLITFRPIEKGREVWYAPSIPKYQTIIVPYWSLPDKKNPTFDLPISNFQKINGSELYWKLEPYVEYEITVAYKQSSLIESFLTSPPKTFWTAVKDRPSYNGTVQTNGPTGKITIDRAVATWSPLVGNLSRKYIIELTQLKGTETFTIETRSLEDVNNPSFDFNAKKPLEKDVEYTWRIKGEDLYGRQTDWSEYKTFTVFDDPFANVVPEIIAPNSTTQYAHRTNFSWKAVPGAKYYRLELFGVSKPSYTDSVIVKNEELTDIHNPSTFVSLPYNYETVHTVSPKTYVMTFKWRIVAYSENDNASKASNELPFAHVLPDPKTLKPEIIAPIGEVPAPVDRLQFSWKEMLHVNNYEFVIYEERQKAGTTQNELIKLGAWTDELGYGRKYDWKNGIFTLNLKDFKWGRSYPANPFPPLRDREFPLLKENTQYYYTIQGIMRGEGRTLVSDRIPFKFRPLKDDEFKVYPTSLSLTGDVEVSRWDTTSSQKKGDLVWDKAPRATSYIISFKNLTKGTDEPPENFTVKEGDERMVDSLKVAEEHSSYGTKKHYPASKAFNIKHLALNKDGLYAASVRPVIDISETNKVYGPWSNQFVFVYGESFDRGPEFHEKHKKPILFPVETSATGTPEIKWNLKVIPFSLHGRKVGATQIFIQNVTKKDTEVVKIVNSRVESYKPETPLSPGTYKVWVRYITGGEMSDWSEPEVFTVHRTDTPTEVTELITPVVSGPLNGSSPSSLVVWSAVHGATHYILSIKNLTDAKDVPPVNRTVSVTELVDSNNPSYIDSNIQPGLYGIWVRAVKDVSGTEKIYSKWSQRLVFAAGVGSPGENINNALQSTKPTITGPASPTSLTPNITWNAVPGAGAYQLYIQIPKQKKVEKVLVVDGNTTSYTPDYSYSAGSGYKAWVRAIGGKEMSLWSEPFDFTVGS